MREKKLNIGHNAPLILLLSYLGSHGHYFYVVFFGEGDLNSGWNTYSGRKCSVPHDTWRADQSPGYLSIMLLIYLVHVGNLGCWVRYLSR